MATKHKRATMTARQLAEDYLAHQITRDVTRTSTRHHLNQLLTLFGGWQARRVGAAQMQEFLAAQKARGADFETGSLMQRAKALVPLLVPLFVSAFRRADELATAMECRCYHGDEGRTKLNVLHYQTRDYLVLGYYAVLVAAVIALR